MFPNKTLPFSRILLTVYLLSKLTFMKPYPTGRVATKGQKSQKIFLLFSNTPKKQRNILQISALLYKKWSNQKIKHYNMLNNLINVIKCFYLLHNPIPF